MFTHIFQFFVSVVTVVKKFIWALCETEKQDRDITLYKINPLMAQVHEITHAQLGLQKEGVNFSLQYRRILASECIIF